MSLFLLPALFGCDGITPATSGCSANAAHLNVYEGQISRVCGCTEGAGTFSQSGALNCTVAYGTTVYFYFVGISSTHQISSTIATTQPVSPTDDVKVRAILMNQIGTINFVDSSGLSGTITVTP